MKIFPAILLAVFTAIRLWVAAVTPVTPIEAYHWMGAHRPDWAFFDGPGGTAALVHLGSALLGDGPLGLRLAFPLLAALATLACFLLVRSIFGSQTGLWAAVALNALPLFNLAAVHAGPELPAAAFTLLAAWALVRALERRIEWWVAVGIFVAAAGQFAYPTIALLAGVAAACIAFRRHHAEWRRPGIYLAIVIPLACLFPAIAWNQAHGWPASALGTWRTEFAPDWPGAWHALAGAIALLSLPAFAAGLFSLAILARSARIHQTPRLILCLAAPFLLLWLRGVLHGEAAETALLLGAALSLGGAVHVFLETMPLRVAGTAALLLAAGCNILPAGKADPWSRSTHDIAWNEVAAALEQMLTMADAGRPAPLFLIAPDPDATAALSYYLTHVAEGMPPSVFLRESQDLSNQFGLWPRYDDFVETAKAPDEYFQEMKAENPYMGRSALYLTEAEPADLPQTITGAFAHVSPYATLTLPAGRKMRVYLCEDYQTMPL
ncbi:MAG: glycosyltransferase family 39 protein [Terrimicrobiaceae bacterium]|nr:glycosyltransferase family 39 protein [Terrimicrobiaceae bacterium]